MKSRYFLPSMVLALIITMLFGYKFFENSKAAKQQAAFVPPPITVTAVNAKSGSWQNYLTSIGTLLAVNGVDISPQIAGTVSKISFTSGEIVSAGQPILELDTSMVQAQLDSSTATMKLADATFKRYTTLYAQKAVSDSDLDSARSAYYQALANVNAIKAQLAFMQITAPFTGRIGLREVNLGQYLAPGTVIATLQSVNPIWIDFPMPTQEIASLKVNGPISLSVDADPKQQYPGKIIAINSAVEQSTRMIMVRAEVENPNGILVPGMFANVTVWLPKYFNVISVPDSAVTYTLYGASIYVLTPKANQQYLANLVSVQPGVKQNGQIAIPTGIKVGDLVVTNGQLKLQNGSVVTLQSTGN